MIKTGKTKKICSRGHTFYKSSDCPVCPICWKNYDHKKKANELPETLSAPAMRALVNAKITTLKKLATYTETDILKLHGIGPSSMPKLRQALKAKGLEFAKGKSTSKLLTVTEYIKSFPEDVQSALKAIRQVIKKVAPQAEERIANGMAAYRLAGKPLVYFAAYKKHISFYATPTGHAAFRKELSIYKQGKTSVQFPLNEPLPISLIEKIVRFRAKENREQRK